MARPSPTWSVYRRTDRDGGAHLDLAGIVAAEFQHEAADLAALLPEAPLYPVLCRAIAIPGRVPSLTLADLSAVAASAPVEIESRQSRRRAMIAAAAVAQSSGRAV